ncbi:hypothetical protein AB0L82_33205 [Nocardia sp. NPDC052001]|uniref:hypothetical protein n=1 Tax=unclassified Nocardia TaxID=2637762 RepID=UPI00342921C1
MNEPVLDAGVRALVGQILARYGTIDTFCLYLRDVLGAPTCELPVLVAPTVGRHRLREREPVG